MNLNFNLELNNLPNSIKIIKFHIGSDYNRELNNLPSSLEYLELPKDYSLKIKNISKGLKNIKCSKDYKFINDFASYKVETYE